MTERASSPESGIDGEETLLESIFEKEDSMNFLNQLLRGIAFIPALVSGIEGLFGSKSGAEKKDAAMSFLESALSTVDAVAAREIVDPDKFKDGVSKIIDGTVECLNASTWAKSGATSPATAPTS
jgi:hypothetical protein